MKNRRKRAYKGTPFKTVNDEDFKTKLDRFIVNSAINHQVLTDKQFKRITSGWKKGRDEKTDEEWYNYYYEELFKQPGWSDDVKTNNDIKYIDYKSPNRKSINHRFSLKSNSRFQLHSVFKPGTYIIDIMFSGHYAYLIAINANTRYLFAELLNDRFEIGKGLKIGKRAIKDVNHYLRAMDSLMSKGMKPVKIFADNEKCFQAAKDYYKARGGIEFQGVEKIRRGVYPSFMKNNSKHKTQPLHSSLGIIDRVIRTLRDMAYASQIGDILPEQMDVLVNMYNKAPHRTLSYYAGEDTSPEAVQSNPDLENFIIRRICQDNYNVKSQDDYFLPEGTKVLVYNDYDSFQKRRSQTQPGTYYIGSESYYKNGKFTIINEEGYVPPQKLPRYRIKPIIKGS